MNSSGPVMDFFPWWLEQMSVILILPTAPRCRMVHSVKIKKSTIQQMADHVWLTSFIFFKMLARSAPVSGMPLIPGLGSNPDSHWEQEEGNTCWWGWFCWILLSLSACVVLSCLWWTMSPRRAMHHLLMMSRECPPLGTGISVCSLYCWEAHPPQSECGTK